MIVGALETLPDGPGPAAASTRHTSAAGRCTPESFRGGCGLLPRPCVARASAASLSPEQWPQPFVASTSLSCSPSPLAPTGSALATIIRCPWRLARAEATQHEDTEHPVQSASDKPLEA
jgi:hypothetical protein